MISKKDDLLIHRKRSPFPAGEGLITAFPYLARVRFAVGIWNGGSEPPPYKIASFSAIEVRCNFAFPLWGRLGLGVSLSCKGEVCGWCL